MYASGDVSECQILSMLDLPVANADHTCMKVWFLRLNLFALVVLLGLFLTSFYVRMFFNRQLYCEFGVVTVVAFEGVGFRIEAEELFAFEAYEPFEWDRRIAPLLGADQWWFQIFEWGDETTIVSNIYCLQIPMIYLILLASFLSWFTWPRKRIAGCNQCGYDLTGNVSGRCPECGAALQAGAVHGD